MRIAVLTPGYAPDPGGVESVVTAVCAGLSSRGVEVEVWAHGPSDSSPSVQMHSGIAVHRFPATRSSRFPVSPRLWRYARAHARDVDLVHAHSYHATAALGSLFIDHAVPVVLTPHYHGGGHTPLARALHVPYRPVGARMLRRADRIVTVSRAEQDHLLADHPGLAQRTSTIHNAVDVTAIHAAEPYPEQPPTVLALGRLEPYKRVDLVLEAFAACSAAGQLVIVGEGSDTARIAALAARNPRAADIRLLGRMSRDEVERWLRTARCVVSMSEHEAFGIVGLEGAAAGASVLLSDLPAHHEVVELTGAERARVVTGAALPAALTASLTAPPSSPHQVRNWSAVVDEHISLYNDVVRRPFAHQRR